MNFIYNELNIRYLDNIIIIPMTVIEELDKFKPPPAPNRAPIADAGGPYEGVPGDEILFDGSGSSDPDESIVLYEWDFNNDGEIDSSGVKSKVKYAFDNAL